MAPPRARARKLVRALVACAVGLVLALVGAELVLRWLLFSDAALARDLGYSLRVPESFGTPDLSPEYWWLQHRWTPREKLQPAPGPDAELGWNGLVIDASGKHYEEDRLGARTPVLLYGDSFAQGVVAREHRFQALLDASELGARYGMLNHGVGGYGVDQAWLMLERTLDRHAAKKPVVIFSMLVDSDLDRSGLAFRGWPKPRLDVADGELVLREPLELDPDRWFDAHAPSVTSWFARYATHRAGLLPESWRDARITREAGIDEKKELHRAILEHVKRFCAARGVEPVVLLFHSGPGIPPKPWMTWQDPFVRAECARIGLALVDVRTYLDALANGDEAELARYFIRDGAGRGHLNEAGNRVALAAIEQAIEHRFDGESIERGIERLRELRASGVIDPSRRPPRERELFGRDAMVSATPAGACIRVGNALAPLYDSKGRDTTCVRAGDDRRTTIAFELDGTARRFRAQLACAKRPGVACDGEPVVLTVTSDGRELLSRSLVAPCAPETLELELAGVRELAFVVTKPKGDVACAWVVLVEPRFE